MADTPESSQSKNPTDAQRTTDTSGNVLKDFETAYMNYMQALQGAWIPEEAQKRFEDAYLDYMRALLQAPNDPLKRIEAEIQYMRVLREARMPPDVQKRFEEAFQGYIRALQGAWAQLDINAVDVGSLVMIGQSIIAAASCLWGALPSKSRSTQS